jgi:recombination protein RecA
LRTQQAKVCAWIDTSDSLDPASAAWSGVDLQRLLWVRCGGAQRQGKKPWTRIEQTLRAGDLLLQGGGFSTLVFDLGSFEPEQVSRIPLATWFRFRALAEKTQASILLLTQHGCAKSSAALLLRLETGTGTQTESTIFSGITHQLAVARQRFDPSPVTPIKKPSQRVTSWQSQTAWSGQR